MLQALGAETGNRTLVACVSDTNNYRYMISASECKVEE